MSDPEDQKLETVELQESDLENVAGGEDIGSEFSVDESQKSRFNEA